MLRAEGVQEHEQCLCAVNRVVKAVVRSAVKLHRVAHERNKILEDGRGHLQGGTGTQDWRDGTDKCRPLREKREERRVRRVNEWTSGCLDEWSL